MGPYEVTTGLKIMRSSIRIKTVTPVSLREFTNVKKNLHILGELLTEKAVRVAGYMMRMFLLLHSLKFLYRVIGKVTLDLGEVS